MKKNELGKNTLEYMLFYQNNRRFFDESMIKLEI